MTDSNEAPIINPDYKKLATEDSFAILYGCKKQGGLLRMRSLFATTATPARLG